MMKLKEEQNVQPSSSEGHLRQLAQVGQISAGIAHEVKNPLTAVKGFLQLVQEEQNNEYLAIASDELENAITTLNNLLQVSKPDLFDEGHQTVCLSVELDSILHLFQDKLYDVQVITEFNDTDVSIVGKKNQFKKAFFNLIKNAIESIEGTGTIIITHQLKGSDVLVSIEDTGKGIPEESLDLLGTPFFTTKDLGTGMGLTQVFSTVYEHGGQIQVDSVENIGTKFIITIPIKNEGEKRMVRKLKVTYEEGFSIKDFLFKNRNEFEARLLEEAINVKGKIEEIHNIGNINLLGNAHKLVLFIVEEREHELINFAKQEGIAWAKYSLTLAFKLEWVQAIRRTIWDFLYNYDELSNVEENRLTFYTQEKQINELVDQFFANFFISYSNFKDGLLETQRQLVENLSVPIIPISQEVCILPLIGLLDRQRLVFIEDKVLTEIEKQSIQTLIVDFSGVTPMEQETVSDLASIIDGIYMMGCKTILTGLRKEVVKTLRNSSGSFLLKGEFKGTLQLALDDVLQNSH
ncbi:ATP-binding protein [Alkalihalobacillus sp. MEB130]|uniref:ATP-binding protein n=1 Tax=Alkalihalobacillus sp. MEB130 TaxID=2976704 RepID=UPI0028DE83AD|nr:ATP-binding protein [Alkalihalobacillus sp. MEB130]MDT8863055.1 ATP-binding protein [Alkalihalobacillus sp. MEB130]